LTKKDQVLKRLSQVIRNDAIYQEPYDVLATHTPFDNLKFVSGGFEDQAAVTMNEEQFYSDVMGKRMDEHQFYVVQGHPGTGKSHFIRWLKERHSKAAPGNEVIVFITRNTNTLKSSIDEILSIPVFSDEFKNKHLKVFMDAQVNLNSEELKQNIIHQFAAIISADQDAPYYREELYDFFVNRRVKEEVLLRENGPIERIAQKLVPEDTSKRYDDIELRFYEEDFRFDTNRLIRALNSDEDRASRKCINFVRRLNTVRKDVVEYLNGKIERVIQNTIKLQEKDLRELFLKIRQELYRMGKNLTLFIEDITSFPGVDRGVIESLVIEHTGENANQKLCRLISVVGITNWYYDSQFPDNLKQRVTGRIMLDEETLFYSKEKVAQMVARYMNAIYQDGEVLKRWYESGALMHQLPIQTYVPLEKWSGVEVDRRIMSIYPFSPDSLWNLYNWLKDKTARYFLLQLKELLQFYILNGTFPHREDEMGSIRLPMLDPTWDDRLKKIYPDEYERISAFVRLYGDGSYAFEEKGSQLYFCGVDEEIFSHFGFDIRRLYDGSRQEGKTETGRPPEAGISKKPERSVDRKDDAGRGKLDEYAEVLQEIDQWIKGRTLRRFIRLRDSLTNAILQFVNWEEEGIPRFLAYKNITDSTVSIEGQSASARKGVQLKRDELGKKALIALAAWNYLGNRSWTFDNSQEHLVNFISWLEANKQEILKAAIAGEVEPEESAEIYLLYEAVMQGILSPNEDIKSDILLLYSEIFRNYDMTIEESRYVRASEKWNELWRYIARNKNDLLNLHLEIITFFNIPLGENSSDILNPKTYYFDSALIMDKLESIIDGGIDMDGLLSRLDRLQSARPFRMIYEVLRRAAESISEQKKLVGELLLHIKNNYVRSFDDHDLEVLIEGTRNFIERYQKVLKNPVTFSITEFLKSQLSDADYFKHLINKAVSFVDQQDIITALQFVASGYIDQLMMCRRAFEDISQLLDRTFEKYKDVSKKVEERRENVERLKAQISSSIGSSLNLLTKVMREVGLNAD